MSTEKNYRRFKRRFKKKLYNFIVALDSFDFGRLRPVCGLLLLAVILFGWTKLPSYETTNVADPQTIAGANLSADIRTTVAELTNRTVDIVALFLPKDANAPLLSDTYAPEPLYSFYLTGKELSYLAEGDITTMNKESRLYLDGLNFTYHQNRIPFNRVTALATTSGTEIEASSLYHVVSTESIFELFHYITYRSVGIMQIDPKDAAGVLLSDFPEDYQKIMITNTGTPVTVQTIVSVQNTQGTDAVPSIITTRYGFNLIDLIKEPNRITICIIALLIALFVLIWYMLPRMNRIGIWFRIYKIRSRKRSSHTPSYKLKKR